MAESDLDARLGALVAEGSTGVTDPAEPRRRGAATLILGGALVIGAGLGLGWGIGRATRGTDSSTEITASAMPAPQTLPAGAVSDAPPSADDQAVDSADGLTADSPVTEPGVGGSDSPAAEPTDAEPATSSAVPPDEVIPPTTTASTAPATSTAPAAPSVVGPSPTIVAAPDGGPSLLPTAFAVLEGGRLTIRGTFTNQAALDQAITALSPLGADGFAVEAVVDPTVVGSRQVPVVVSDAAIFQRGSAILGDGGQPVLDLLASAMAATQTSRLIIEGHTDSQGSEAYNFALSQQRVAAVFAYLAAKGVDPSRLELAPRGETEPVADNGTDEGRSRNRRVELIFAT